MEDKDFCIEYVKRIAPEYRNQTKTNKELISIVEENQLIPVDEMFKDSQLEQVYGLASGSVASFVYSFVRDNQQLFQHEPAKKLKIK
jgi:hypothetical protein